MNETTVKARYIGAISGAGMTGREYVQLFFTVRGRRDPVRVQFNAGGPADPVQAKKYAADHKAGDAVQLLRIGAGKYAGYRLTGY